MEFSLEQEESVANEVSVGPPPPKWPQLASNTLEDVTVLIELRVPTNMKCTTNHWLRVFEDSAVLLAPKAEDERIRIQAMNMNAMPISGNHFRVVMLSLFLFSLAFIFFCACCG